MLSLSFSKTLYLLMTVLALWVLILTGSGMWHAGLRYQDSQRIAGLAETDKELFKALKLRSLRPDVQTALLTQDDPTAKVEDVKAAMAAIAEGALTALASANLPNTQALMAPIQSAWASVKRDYGLIDDEARKPRADRHLPEPWFKSVDTLVTQITAASKTVNSSIATADPLLAEMIEARQLATMIRVSFQCAPLRETVEHGRRLDAQQRAKVEQFRGVIGSAWAALDDVLSRPGIPASLTTAAAAARRSQQSQELKMDQIINALDDTATSAPPPGVFLPICLAPLDPIMVIGQTALDEVVAISTDHQRDAEYALLSHVAAFLTALAISLAGALIIRRRFTGPVHNILRTIERLMAQDYATPVAQSRYDDEFGTITHSLDALRASAGTAQRLTDEQAAAAAVREQQAKRLETLVASFRNQITAVVQGVSTAANTLQSSSRSMTVIAEESARGAVAVASAAEEASANVQTVSAATEELAASINEINRQLSDSTRSSAASVVEAERTSLVMGDLAESAERIGTVVKLIEGIASQVNLLALNATIEAARAGEAGKGFAVVANEVKNLANQTGTAAQDITKQITDVQSQTRKAIEAIAGITVTIRRTNEISTAIASAAEEQGAATGEISRNILQASHGTRLVTETISHVKNAASETGAAASQVLDAAELLSTQAKTLHSVVDAFISQVRMA